MRSGGGTDYGASYLESVGLIASDQTAIFAVDRKSRELIAFGAGPAANYVPTLASHIYERIYMFRAERLNVDTYAFGSSTDLLPDASNLAQVLNNLQSNPKRLQRYNDHVRELFPDIGWVGVRPVPSSSAQVRIQIWPAEEVDTEREDLALSLAESGTG